MPQSLAAVKLILVTAAAVLPGIGIGLGTGLAKLHGSTAIGDVQAFKVRAPAADVATTSADQAGTTDSSGGTGVAGGVTITKINGQSTSTLPDVRAFRAFSSPS